LTNIFLTASSNHEGSFAVNNNTFSLILANFRFGRKCRNTVQNRFNEKMNYSLSSSAFFQAMNLANFLVPAVCKPQRILESLRAYEDGHRSGLG